jgi:hypothetical protein
VIFLTINHIFNYDYTATLTYWTPAAQELRACISVEGTNSSPTYCRTLISYFESSTTDSCVAQQ